MNENNPDLEALANQFNEYYNQLKKEREARRIAENAIAKKSEIDQGIEELAKKISQSITKDLAKNAAWVAFPDKTYDFGLGSIDFNQEKREAFIKGYEKAIQDLKSTSVETNTTPIIMECDITINEDENY